MMSSVIQYLPFKSSVDPAFWSQFTTLKLNELGLNVDPVDIKGIFSNHIKPNIPPFLSLQFNSFDKHIKTHPGDVSVPGRLIHTNTIEDFKNANKTDLLKAEARSIWSSILNGTAEVNPAVLSSFLLFTFADLKKYHYYYWFGFPVFSTPSFGITTKPMTLKEKIQNDEQIGCIKAAYKNLSEDVNPAFFVVLFEEDLITLLPLTAYLNLETNLKEVWLGICDPSWSPSHPGWPLRNLLTLAAIRWSEVSRHTVLCLRESISKGCSFSSIDQSLVLEVELTQDASMAPSSTSEMPTCLGWEPNERGKMGPRFVDLKTSMDPTRIAESAVELNLKLMRWRTVPSLDLKIIREAKCLIFGAGTLGCNVARCLLGWGVQTITIVDSGRVSHSNPVRQSLFNFEDCVGEGKFKAEAAAEALRKIFPRLKAKGVVAHIPGPGHPISESQVKEVEDNLSTLTDLVDSHDVLFLLTDSRESRWLPTLLGAVKQKIVLTSALGFESILVMRHGMRRGVQTPIEDSNLGCYFCHDVVVPSDSTSDRALDEQCTVTRPGMAFMAAGHVVELLTSLLQHPLKGGAPPPPEEGVLGVVPHAVRYILGQPNHIATSTPAFLNCSACSEMVRKAYSEEGFKFLLNVFNSPSYLQDVSGLSQLLMVDDSMMREIGDEEFQDT